MKSLKEFQGIISLEKQQERTRIRTHSRVDGNPYNIQTCYIRQACDPEFMYTRSVGGESLIWGAWPTCTTIVPLRSCTKAIEALVHDFMYRNRHV
jgi:hypothetical protein